MGKQWKQCQTLFWGGSKITADGDCSHEIKRRLLLGRKVMTNFDSIFRSRNITLTTNVHLWRLWFFHWSCMDVRIRLWRKLSVEELMLLNCGVGEDSCESLGLQGDPTSPSQRRAVLGIHWKDWCWSWTPIIWPPAVKNWLLGKDPDVGKDWRQGEKGMTEDEMVGWHHWLDGHEFEQALKVGDGQGGLACCSPWGCRVRHDWATELNWVWICSSLSLSSPSPLVTISFLCLWVYFHKKLADFLLLVNYGKNLVDLHVLFENF